MSIRAKFKCVNIQPAVSLDGEVNRKEVRFEPVVGGSDENLSFSKATPSGSLVLQITNPDAFEQFVLNQEYYLDISSASGLASVAAPQKKVEFVPTPSPKPPGEAGIRMEAGLGKPESIPEVKTVQVDHKPEVKPVTPTGVSPATPVVQPLEKPAPSVTTTAKPSILPPSSSSSSSPEPKPKPNS